MYLVVSEITRNDKHASYYCATIPSKDGTKDIPKKLVAITHGASPSVVLSRPEHGAWAWVFLAGQVANVTPTEYGSQLSVRTEEGPFVTVFLNHECSVQVGALVAIAGNATASSLSWIDEPEISVLAQCIHILVPF